MSKYPAEILGFSSSDRSSILHAQEQGRMCPFMRSACTKENGVCSVYYGGRPIAICPNRLLEDNTVMRDIAREHFETEHDLLVFREVYSGARDLGSFDFVMVKHKSLSDEIEDFVIIEFQTVDTTNTGKLNQALRDFDQGNDIIEKTYGFGLNWANVWKRCFIQILNKGRVLESWGQKAYWVAQEPAYQYFVEAYGLSAGMQKGTDGTTVFGVYDLVASSNSLTLRQTRLESTRIRSLLEAFSTNPNIPAKGKFIEQLQRRSNREFGLKLDFGVTDG
jgi:hypothetical protein